jgi:rhodanese-related sulfurtransferase
MQNEPEQLLPKDLAKRLAAGERFVLLDVREAEELALCALPGVTHVPLGELSQRHVELDPDAPTVCICHHGRRSAHAAAGLVRLGFERVFNLVGGVERWAIDVDRTMPRY